MRQRNTDSIFALLGSDQPWENPLSEPTIALSVQWHSFPERFDWAVENGFALEYAPKPDAFDLLPQHATPYLKQGVPVRYHGFFPGYEIGDTDADAAEKAMAIHLAALEAMAGLGQQVITVHIGLNPEQQIDSGRAVENLSRLVDRGNELGITVSLENLKTGISSDPETLADWAEQSGAMLTLDIGHAACCEQTQSGLLYLDDFLDLFSHRLVGVHMYEAEWDRHYPPKDMTVLGSVVDRLLDIGCHWWTIELIDPKEALNTRRLLLDHIAVTANSGSQIMAARD